MIESVETVKDVEKQLDQARSKLQSFEDAVDRGRLLQRLKMSSPAHPVLLFRGFFMFMTVLMMLGALAILIVPFVNGDLSRQIAKFDAVVPGLTLQGEKGIAGKAVTVRTAPGAHLACGVVVKQ